MKIYTTPELTMRGSAIDLTRGVPGGESDADMITKLVPAGSVGFGL